MIQFNLLPDVKQQYVKARQMQRLVTLVSIAASAASLFILIVMLVTVDVVQRASLNDLNGNIKKYSNQLKSVKDLDKILTVQNQLNTLTDLHDKKVVTSRLFDYISQVTPSSASIRQLSVDFGANTMIIDGSAPTLESVNTFTDDLKATTYATDTDKTGATKAFSSIVLASFSRDNTKASFNITLNFDPAIFDSGNTVTLTVPKGTGGADLFGDQGSKQ